MTKKSPLQVTHPELAAQWHPTLNGDLTPADVTIGTKNKHWWLTPECGHGWDATPLNKLRMQGCPYCTTRGRKRLLTGFNDLATTHPDIASEWHPTKNGNLTPDQVILGAGNLKRWWLGPCGHEWDASASDRARGRGCPYCTTQGRKRILPGYNDLATTHPDVAAEWHPTKNGTLQPTRVAPRSNKEYWWLGECRHEWVNSPDVQTQRPHCPYCTYKELLTGFNDLATTHPNVAAQWHTELNGEVTPQDVMHTSKDTYGWTGECGHHWETSVNSQVNGYVCPYCSRRKVLVGFNDLATTHPTFAEQWHPTKNVDLKPTDIVSGADIHVWWLGECGHEWSALCRSRTGPSAANCPYCAMKKVLRGFNDLETTHPHIAAQWHPTRNEGLLPCDITVGANRDVWWLGECGHEWHATAWTRQKFGCPICSGHQLLPGYNDLATTHPKVSLQWHPSLNGNLKPEQFSASSADEVYWLGKCRHTWKIAIRNRAYGESDCPYCSGHKVLKGFNDLANTHPEVAAHWHPTKNIDITPHEVSRGSTVTVWWECPEGHEALQSISKRITLRAGCIECGAKLLVSAAESELSTIVDKILGTESDTQTSVRSVIQGELDIYIPQKNLAIEFNGLYWHSEDRGKGRNYHATKSQDAVNLGIHLIHVWEDDWRDRRDIVVRALAHRLGVTERLNEPGVLLVPDESLTRRYGARTLTTEVLTHSESASFLEVNHIQGSSVGTVYTGLRDKDGILRAVFVAKRIGNTGHEGSWRIERYATRGIVPGGFTKLMKFTENLAEGITKWVTFSDGALSDGGLYRNYGFMEEGFVPPDYQYIVKGTRVHKFNYRLKRFRDDPNLEYQEGLSERELASLNKIPRIWDSGKTRWVKSLTH